MSSGRKRIGSVAVHKNTNSLSQALSQKVLSRNAEILDECSEQRSQLEASFKQRELMLLREKEERAKMKLEKERKLTMFFDLSVLCQKRLEVASVEDFFNRLKALNERMNRACYLLKSAFGSIRRKKTLKRFVVSFSLQKEE